MLDFKLTGKIMIENASRSKLKKTKQLLKDKRVRDAEGLFIVEGLKIIRDMEHGKHDFDFVLVSYSFMKNKMNADFLSALNKKGILLFKTADKDFEKVSSLKNSQGILAIIKKPKKIKLTVPAKKDAILVLCDGIQDPGNLGTILRTSCAFEVDAILLAGKTVDIYNPKVVRASSGTVLNIPIYDCKTGDLDCFRQNGYHILASRPDGGKKESIAETRDFKSPLILVFGSEGSGISKKIEAKVDAFFNIPIHKKVESLNVTAAVAISLYEFRRLDKYSK